MRAKITDKMTLEALEESGGYIAEAARSLGVAASTVSRRVSKSKKLQKAVEEIIGRNIDVAESKMMKIIRDDNHPKQFVMVMFYLKCKAGFVESSKIEHSVDANNETGVILIAPPVAKIEEPKE